MTQVNESPEAVVTAYLTAFYSGDFDGAREVVAESFSFEGPFLRVSGKQQFFAGAEGLRQIVCGHRILKQWRDADDVCTIYEVDLATPVGAGTVVMSEWHTVRDDQLISARVIFDSAAFRELVAGTSTT